MQATVFPLDLARHGVFSWVTRWTAPLFPDRTQALLQRARSDRQIAQWIQHGRPDNAATPFVPPMIDMMGDDDDKEDADTASGLSETASDEADGAYDTQWALGHLTQSGAVSGYQKYGENPVAIDYGILQAARREAVLERQGRQADQKPLSHQV